MKTRAEQIRDLNDQFRRRPSFGSVFITAGVQNMGSAFVVHAFEKVIAYRNFSERNDPHGEHDFGSFIIDDALVFFKIDTYDVDLQNLSPDPTDTSVTRRVLTIMLAEEY